MNYMKNSNENYQVINLKKKYKSIFGVPVLDKFETSIYKIHFYKNCLSCDFCNDICCSNGVDIDIENVKRIMEYGDKIENYIKKPKTEWFFSEFKIDNEFPGGQFTRTKVKDGFCVFINKNGRGCLIQKFCIDNNIDFHILKPIVSALFPITFDENLLHPAIQALDKSLICLNQGPSLYLSVRNEILYYFGVELVNELDYYEKKFEK